MLPLVPSPSTLARTPTSTPGDRWFRRNAAAVLRFDTNGLGTILSASLTIYVNANEINQSTSVRPST